MAPLAAPLWRTPRGRATTPGLQAVTADGTRINPPWAA